MAKCFIIMPISTPKALLPTYRGDTDHFLHALDHLFVPAVEKAGFEPIRPRVEGAEVIHARIIKNIEKAELVLCDMSALNPNVFFELGIRTAVDKPTCMVVDDITENVPFDTSIVNYHTYRSSLDPWVLAAEIDKLVTHITAAKEGGERNPLWHYFGLTTRAEFSGKETGIEAKVDLMSMRLDGLARQIADRERPRREQKAEKESNPDYLLYRRVADIAGSAGIEVAGGSITDENVMISCYGEVPTPVKNEMTALAKENGRTLTISVSRKKRE
jgi:hypothetical protein